MLQDYAANPAHDLGWRARIGESGAGALGDLGSHVIDMARYLCGDITGMSAAPLNTLVDRGPTAAGIDDLAAMVVEFENGDERRAGGELGAARPQVRPRLRPGVRARRDPVRVGAVQRGAACSTGDVSRPDNGYRDGADRRAGSPTSDRFVSVPAQGMGYRDMFTIGVSRALTAIAAGQSAVAPSFADGLASGARGRRHAALGPRGGWVDVARPDAAELLHG